MKFGFPCFFLQFGLGGAGVQIVETRFFWEVLWWKHIHMKNMQKTMEKKTKSSEPWARSGERPGWGHRSELFVFLFLAVWPKPRENQKKLKKSLDPWARSGERPGWGHGSELFFSMVFGRLAKTSRNQKTKNKKSSNPWARSGERPGWGHGSELFVLVFCFHGFLQFGQNLEKPKKPKVQTMGKVWGEAWLGTWVWTSWFLFFLCFHVFCNLAKPSRN